MALNLHLLRLFATVARTGSFSRAADILRISQPAISKSVREFELQVGCQLLVRSPRGVVMTREGEALARHAGVIFAAERAAEDEIGAMRGLHRGSLTIGASTTIATYLLPAYLGRFCNSHPGVELTMLNANTKDVALALVQKDIEIALVEGPVDFPSLEREIWRTDAMVLVVSPSHHFALRVEIEPEELANETLIVRETGSGSLQVVVDALRGVDVTPARLMRVGGTEAIKQLVMENVGVAIVSRATVRDQLALGRLVVVAMRALSITRPLWRLRSPTTVETPAVKTFLRLLRTDCAAAVTGSTLAPSD